MPVITTAPLGHRTPYHDVFNRAVEHGQWFYTPCLCWKEFAPDYVGAFRPETRICEPENHELPTMLRMVFDQMQNGQVAMNKGFFKT